MQIYSQLHNLDLGCAQHTFQSGTQLQLEKDKKKQTSPHDSAI